MYVCMYLCIMYVCMCLWVYVCVYVCIHICMYYVQKCPWSIPSDTNCSKTKAVYVYICIVLSQQFTLKYRKPKESYTTICTFIQIHIHMYTYMHASVPHIPLKIIQNIKSHANNYSACIRIYICIRHANNYMHIHTNIHLHYMYVKPFIPPMHVCK